MDQQARCFKRKLDEPIIVKVKHKVESDLMKCGKVP